MIALATVGDLHCGGVTGLLPPEFPDRNGNIIGQNVVQAWLWECWKHYCAKVWRYPVKALIVNGDTVDGTQRKSGGVGAMPDMADQRRAACLTLDYLLAGFQERPALFVVRGTPYHVGNEGDAEEAIAEALHAEEYDGEGAGFRARAVLNLQVGEVLCNFAHHVAYSAVNQATPTMRDIQRALRRAQAGAPMADVLIRSHVHNHCEVGTGWGKPKALTLPCWQMPTSWQYKGSAAPLVDIGGGVVWINPTDKRETRVECELYPLPSLAAPIHALPL